MRKSLKGLSNLKHWEETNDTQQEINPQVMIELTSQNTSRYTPPPYTLIAHSIPISANNSRQNLTASTHYTLNNSEDIIPSSVHKKPNKKTAPSGFCGWFKSFCSRKLLAYSILLCMLANLALVISFTVYQFRRKEINLISVAGALSYIAYNLNSHPILDIQIQDEKASCPQDYYTMMLGTWPGTTAGCDCHGGSLKREACDRSENSTDVFCDDVDRIKPIDLFSWGGSKWCVQRAQLANQYKRAVECAPGFRKCSSGICMLATLNCPVTKVSIQSTGIYQLKTGTDRFVVTEISPGESPMIDLDITPNDIPCFSSDYFASGPVAPYILIDENENGCSKYGLDNQYSFQLDSLKQKQLFDENDFPGEVYDLPYYAKVYQRTDSVLSYRRRLDVAEKDLCLNIDTEVLQRSSEASKNLNGFVQITLILALIIQAILVLSTVSQAIVFGVADGWSEFMKGRNSKIWISCYLGIEFIQLADLVVMFAATTHFRKDMMGSQDYLMKLSENSCFLDFQSQSAVGDYQVVVNNLTETLFKYSLSLMLITTFAVFACVYLLCKHRK